MNLNEQQMNTMQNMPPKSPMSSSNSPEKNTGALIGTIIIIIILVIGGLYMWGKNLVDNGTMSPAEVLQAPDTATEALNNQGTSTKASDIEADLNTTDLTDIDKELGNIEQQLGQ
ncbi:MAG: hypothetical protein AAB769_02020 [Patescibacteria group bacterium]